MEVTRVLKEKRNEILKIAAKYGATNIRIFGSVARGESDESSDIDFLVQFSPGVTLMRQAALVRELEALLGGKVDIVSERGLRPKVRERILKEAIPL